MKRLWIMAAGSSWYRLNLVAQAGLVLFDREQVVAAPVENGLGDRCG